MKTYVHNKVKYQFVPKHRAWKFDYTNSDGYTYSFIRKLTGASEMAHRIAKLIDGSFERQGKIGGEVRANINRMIDAATKQ